VEWLEIIDYDRREKENIMIPHYAYAGTLLIHVAAVQSNPF
jgi:hypothetical protein